ncbi:MAG: NFACT family protein [Lachnospiraceae bacterium]|nr:NFACT family protein [Lachnospiraceae bacterium]
MAFDGITVSNIVYELQNKIIGGRIYKIYQPEPDELNLIIKTSEGNYRLLLSANATLPLLYLTTENKNNPMTAPNLCMLLRKHIGNGRIVQIDQPGFERIVVFHIEHFDEMGDLCRKKLIIELMGKYSNIIFTDDQDMILDSIKRIGSQISSVREVLPGRRYEFPPNQDKISPFEVDKAYYEAVMITKPTTLAKMIYGSITGFSSLIANEICYRAGLDGSSSTELLRNMSNDKECLYEQLMIVIRILQDHQYTPGIYYDDEEIPVEFASIELTMYSDARWVRQESVSETLQEYYAGKNRITRIRQKSSDLRKIVSTILERTVKKYDLQRSQMKDTEKRDTYRVYGELINAYGYGIEEGAKSFTALNYYTDEEITVPLDPTLTPAENSKRYFAKYNKLKRTYEALTEQIAQTEAELLHLRSIQTSLELTLEDSDLADIRRELTEYGYVKAHGPQKKKERIVKSKPFHYISSDGYHMYVGKNNYQNEEITFKLANSNDLWFHAKQAPGSHVIVKTEGREEIPDRTYEEAARLAAYYSSERTGSKVDIDYTRRSNLKKTPGGAPGFVIYHTNYSMAIEPDIRGIREIQE